MKALYFFVLLIASSALALSPGMAAEPAALSVGATAPDFTLPYSTRDSVSSTRLTLSAEVGKGPIVLAFYPADWSSGCTREVCTFRDKFADFAKLGVRVWGISGDYPFAHHEWAKQQNLPFALLSDHDHAVAKLYNSFNPERGYNRRTVYVVGSDGKLAYINPEYKVGDDADYLALKKALAGIK